MENDFKKYMHIEKLNSTTVKNITLGECYIFPKIDGTNGSICWNNELLNVSCFSRNRQLTFENDNAGFMNYVYDNKQLIELCAKYQNYIFFGEWLVPHSIKTYQKNAWNKFYIFDVYDKESEKYIHYENYRMILNEYDVDYIAPICKIKNPSIEKLYEIAVSNDYLIENNSGSGEGLVIKRYDYINSFGNTIWAKLVTNEFKTVHKKLKTQEIKESQLIEEKIVNKYVTGHLIDKEFSKIENESGWTSKSIPRLFNTVYYSLVSEETWNFIKEFKNPRIDFKYLNQCTINKIKELKGDLF